MLPRICRVQTPSHRSAQRQTRAPIWKPRNTPVHIHKPNIYKRNYCTVIEADDFDVNYEESMNELFAQFDTAHEKYAHILHLSDIDPNGAFLELRGLLVKKEQESLDLQELTDLGYCFHKLGRIARNNNVIELSAVCFIDYVRLFHKASVAEHLEVPLIPINGLVSWMHVLQLTGQVTLDCVKFMITNVLASKDTNEKKNVVMWNLAKPLTHVKENLDHNILDYLQAHNFTTFTSNYAPVLFAILYAHSTAPTEVIAGKIEASRAALRFASSKMLTHYYSALIHFHISRGQLDTARLAAEAALDRQLGLRILSLDGLTQALVQAGRSNDAYLTVWAFVEAKILDSTFPLRSLLQHLIAEGNTKHARVLISNVLASPLVVELDFARIAITFCASEKMYVDAMMIFNRVKKRHTELYELILPILRANNVESVIPLFHEFVNANMRPSLRMLEIVLSVAAHSGNVGMCVLLYNEIEKNHLVSVKAATEMVRVYLENDNRLMALNYGKFIEGRWGFQSLKGPTLAVLANLYGISGYTSSLDELMPIVEANVDSFTAETIRNNANLRLFLNKKSFEEFWALCASSNWIAKHDLEYLLRILIKTNATAAASLLVHESCVVERMTVLSSEMEESFLEAHILTESPKLFDYFQSLIDNARLRVSHCKMLVDFLYATFDQIPPELSELQSLYHHYRTSDNTHIPLPTLILLKDNLGHWKEQYLKSKAELAERDTQ